MQLYRDERLASVYDRGNEMPTRALRNWVDYLGSLVPRRPDARILDVGSGTGMFTAAMAQRLRAALVVGVEPSSSMLRRAQRGPRVSYVQGSAEALPIRSSTVDCVLLSRVVHHLVDRQRCGREFARVTRQGGRLVIRTTVRERLDADETQTPRRRRWPADTSAAMDRPLRPISPPGPAFRCPPRCRPARQRAHGGPRWQ